MDDKEPIRAVLEAGVSFFDGADICGARHGERVLRWLWARSPQATLSLDSARCDRWRRMLHR